MAERRSQSQIADRGNYDNMSDQSYGTHDVCHKVSQPETVVTTRPGLEGNSIVIDCLSFLCRVLVSEHTDTSLLLLEQHHCAFQIPASTLAYKFISSGD